MPEKRLVVAPLTVESLVDVDERMLAFQHESYTLLAELVERAEGSAIRICDDVNEALEIADVIVLCSAIDFNTDHGSRLVELYQGLQAASGRDDLDFLLVTFSGACLDNARDGRLIKDGLCVLNPSCDDVWNFVTSEREPPTPLP